MNDIKRESKSTDPEETSQSPSQELEVKQTQRAFLANLRHELCTPLNAIIGYSEMLLEDAEEEGLEDFIPELQKIHSAGKELLALINDILDPAKIKAGKLDLDLESLGADLRHELRTPLNAVIGCTEMLLEDAKDRGQADFIPYLERIHAVAKRFLALINDIVNFSRIEAGEMDADPETAATPPMIQDVVTTIRPLAEDDADSVSADRGHLLVVDDNEMNRDTLSRHLERQGHTVAMAENGRQALEMIKTHPFDLVLLDIMMPEMNGFQVLQRLKSDDTWRDIPVIMISALDEIDSVVRCIEMGAEDYLPKPLDPVLLRARINASLEKKRLRDQEVEYLQNVTRVTAAAAAVEAGEFGPESLADVAQRTDGLGQLARVFQSMAREVYAREQRLTLTAFSRGLSTLRERGEVMRLVLDTVTDTLGAERAALWLLDDGQYRLTGARPGGAHPEASSRACDELSRVGSARRGLPRGALPAEGSLAAWLARERRPLLLISDDHSPQAEDLRRAEATLAVPLPAGEKLLGILTLGKKRSGDLYTQEDLELLTTLAHSAALALENTRLHEERMAILRKQLAQVTAAQEEERQRIARELHDGVGPALASLNIRLHTARKLLERDHHPVAEEIEELAELVQANIRDIRRLIYDLRPAALDKLGLVPALREYVARYQEEQGLEVALALPEGDERLPALLETVLFRIVQEALANVAKHAQARRVEVTMARERGEVILRVADDGRGFDPQAPQSGTHLGLWSMRERVEQLGGQFEVESAPGRGTKLTITIVTVGNRK